MTFCIQATWDDVPHLTEEQKQKLWDAIPEHQRDARTKGIPVLGSGRVFPVGEEDIRVDPFAIPVSWPQIVGLDFGWDHPFAAARCAWDRDNDIFYVCAVYRQREAIISTHAAAIRPWGEWLPIAWPHDGLKHDTRSGKQIAQLYREEHLDLLPDHSTHEEGGYGVEAGIIDMIGRMKTGRWKVFSTCGDWFDEFRFYHRKDGLIVKERDDALDASRIALMMRRHAIVKPKAKAWAQTGIRGVV